MHYPPVLTKVDFVRRYCREGGSEFGNTGPQWLSLADFLQSNYQGLVHIRNRTAGGPTYYNISSEDVRKKWHEVAGNGKGFYLAGMAPTEKTLLQGELQEQPGGLYLHYTTIALPMREALAKESKEARGIMVIELLRHYLCPNSLDWINVLLERYRGHIVEFSCYSCTWGTIPGYNTVIWEVRNY